MSVSLGVTGRKLRFESLNRSVVAWGLALAALAAPSTLAALQGAPASQSQSGAPSRGTETRQASSGRGNSMPPWEWWNDADVQKELGLSAEKIKRIDDIFERRSKDLKPMAEEFGRQVQVLDAMTKAAVVDEATYALQVTQVESLGARLRESRTVMLYRIYRELQPEQYRKLQDILARRAARFNGGRGRE